MSDAPIQTVLQQRDARPVPGEHLEVLGKHAATSWVMGKSASLHAAVVAAVHDERLAPEQVRRVVEFANQDAYLQEFRKEGGSKVVHFDCGPADPAQVLQDLNDGGGGSLYDTGDLDYRLPPSLAKVASLSNTQPMDKTAAAEKPAVPGLPPLTKLPSLPKTASSYEDQLWGLFSNEENRPLPMAEPLRPLVDVRTKLASMCDALANELNKLELDFTDVSQSLYQSVKQASLEGYSLGDIVSAWSAVDPSPVYVKVAFKLLSPQLRRDCIYPSLDAIGASLQKQASVGTPNPDHPLLQQYADFIGTLNKLATARALLEEYSEGKSTADLLLKQAAAGGVIGAIGKGLSVTGKGIDAAVKPVAHILVGPAGAKTLAPVLAGGTKLTGGLGAGLAGLAAVQSVTDRPGVRGTLQVVKKVVPGTAEYNERRYRTQMGM